MFRKFGKKGSTGANVASQPAVEASAEKDRYGLIPLVDQSSEAPGYDIVAVHGLGGTYDKTWTADNGSFWLKDFLPADAAHARIFSYGYDSSPFFSRGVTNIEDEALILLNRVHGVRSQTPEQRIRPICFIGHSLGGIIIKKTLILANENVGRFGDLLQHVEAVVFFGVPHQGARIAFWAHFAAKITKTLQSGLGTNNRFVKDLEKDSSVLDNISTQFIHRAAELERVYTFFETAKLNGVLIVDKKSARLKIANEILDGINDADHSSICKFRRLDSRSYTAVRQGFQELQRLLQTTSMPGTNEGNQELLRSLAFLSMDDRYHAIDSPVAGTCEWLYHQLSFRAWRDPKPDEPLNDRLLWLKANAGAGKSTLMKAMYQKSRQQATSYTLCHFFNARSPVQALDNSFCGMLRSLLWRLLTYDLSLLSGTPELNELKQQNRRVAEAWHLKEVKYLLSRCLRKVQGKSVYIYIDALDECPEDQARDAVRFFDVLAAEIGAVRLLFSSRFCPYISHKGREIYMGLHNAPDISKYIDTHLPSMIDGQSSQSLRTLIGNRSSGLFLWTVLAVNDVVKANDRSLAHRDIQDLVEKIPRDLKLMIEDILRKMDPVHRSKACLIFNWVLLASDALDPLEVFAIIRFDPQKPAANDARQWQSDFATMERATRTFSGGLLEVKSTMDRYGKDQMVRQYVQFIHESVRDHLQTSNSLKRLLTESPALEELIPNHTSLAEFCVDYIGQVPGFGDKCLDEDEMAKLLDIHADIFRVLCASNPYLVSRSYEVLDVAEDHKTPTIDHSNADLNAEQYTQLSEYLAGEAWVSDLYAALANLADSVRFDAEAKTYLLMLAFLPKHENLRKSLELLAPSPACKIDLPKGGDSQSLKFCHDYVTSSTYQRLKTPFPLLRRVIDEIFLHLRFAQDDKALERLTAFLIAETPFPKMNLLRSMICVSNFKHQLDMATRGVHTCKWDYAYKWDIDLSERSWQNQAFVRLAAGYGLRSVLEKLLDLSPHNLNVVDSRGWTPLDHALESGCASTSALLLQNGAEVNMERSQGYSATVIMKHGTSFAETLISHLVENKVQVSILEGLLVSSVHASKPGLIDCLSKGGADLNAKFDNGRDALILASWLDDNKNADKVIKALLRHGATPHCADHYGRTALHYISRRPDCKAVEMLLDRKPDVNAADRQGQTPLDFALIYGNSEVAELLRWHGAKSGSCAKAVRAYDDQRSTTTTKSSDEWVIDSDQGSVPWDSDSAD